jgi:hypothetical protein
MVTIAGCGPSNGGPKPGNTVTALEVTPASVTLAVDGTTLPAPVTFTVQARYGDGHADAVADAVLMLDLPAQLIGELSGAQFSATGNAAGSGKLIASALGKTASASVTVTVHQTHLGPNVPSDGPTKFGGNPGMGPLSPTVLYPLDGALMPATVKAPDIQWEGGGGTGLYRVRMTVGGASIESYLAANPAFTYDWRPSPADWSLMVASANGQAIRFAVDHWDAQSGAQLGAEVRVDVVTADVRGAIYYWDLSDGRMQRIDETGRAPAIPKPPANPTDANNRCVACHVVSRDGRYLSGALWGGGLSGAVFDLSDPKVRTADPAPTLAGVDKYTTLFSTFNPDASRLLVNVGTGLKLVDPKSGAVVPTAGTPLPTANVAHPTWSPDGTLVAFVNNISGSTWAVDYTSGDLQLLPVVGADTFGAPMPLVANSTGDPAFKAPSWPSFSPDSQWIAYAAGVHSRARQTITDPGTGMTTVNTYPGALFLVSRNGGAPTRLDVACAAARDCYLPNFSPYDSGGYLWMVFYSLRDYGNAQAGTKGTSRRQMWVTAIDKSKLGSGDPSRVPYWLPDQDPKTDNMSAYWALPPPVQ